MIKIEEIFIVNIPQYLFATSLIGEFDQKTIVRSMWLIRKYQYSIYCYNHAFKAFEDHFNKPNNQEFGFYFNTLEWIEQVICSEYQFQITVKNGVLYSRGDNKSKWYRLNMCYNSIKHYGEIGIRDDILHRNVLVSDGFSNLSETISFNELFEVIRENESEIRELVG
jgi:hypothetical protein